MEASPCDPKATETRLAIKTQEMQAANKGVLWTRGSLTLPLFILKFSPRYGKFSKPNIFNFELLLLEVGWFHGSGSLSINKTKSIIITAVGSLLKEHVYLSSGCPCTWTHMHTDCHFNSLSPLDSLGVKEQKPYRDSGNISMNMVKNS